MNMNNLLFEPKTLKEAPRCCGVFERLQAQKNKKNIQSTSNNAVGSLTNYKKVVDNFQTYGLTSQDLLMTQLKIKRQRDFLNYSYIENNSTGQQFSLKDCIVSLGEKWDFKVES